ncbi:hypothetical protein CBL_07256 [Carabus blaptoides fortunei]
MQTTILLCSFVVTQNLNLPNNFHVAYHRLEQKTERFLILHQTREQQDKKTSLLEGSIGWWKWIGWLALSTGASVMGGEGLSLNGYFLGECEHSTFLRRDNSRIYCGNESAVIVEQTPSCVRPLPGTIIHSPSPGTTVTAIPTVQALPLTCSPSRHTTLQPDKGC